jgi:hypothetical protein
MLKDVVLKARLAYNRKSYLSIHFSVVTAEMTPAREMTANPGSASKTTNT